MNRLLLAPTLAASARRATFSGDAAGENQRLAGATGKPCKDRRRSEERKMSESTDNTAAAEARLTSDDGQNERARARELLSGPTDVILRDGSTVRLRSPLAEEVEPVVQFLRNLSPESYTQRFHGAAKIDASLM